MDEVSIFDYISEKTRTFEGMLVKDIMTHYNIVSKAKSINFILISKMLNLANMDNNFNNMIKQSIVFKTVNICNNKVRESMSFPKIDFFNMLNNNWMNSDIYNEFGKKKIILFLFKKTQNNTIFLGYTFIVINKQDLYDIFLVWERVKYLVIENQLFIGGNNGFSVLNFPKKNESNVAHIRPHDTNSKEGKVLLPSGKRIINYCFWLNNTFIEKKLIDGGII